MTDLTQANPGRPDLSEGCFNYHERRAGREARQQQQDTVQNRVEREREKKREIEVFGGDGKGREGGREDEKAATRRETREV